MPLSVAIYPLIRYFSDNPVLLLVSPEKKTLQHKTVYSMCARGFLPLKDPADSGWLEQ